MPCHPERKAAETTAITCSRAQTLRQIPTGTFDGLPSSRPATGMAQPLATKRPGPARATLRSTTMSATLAATRLIRLGSLTSG